MYGDRSNRNNSKQSTRFSTIRAFIPCTVSSKQFLVNVCYLMAKMVFHNRVTGHNLDVVLFRQSVAIANKQLEDHQTQSNLRNLGLILQKS